MGRALRLDCAVVVVVAEHGGGAVAGAAALSSVGSGLGSTSWVDRPPSLVGSLLKSSSSLHFGSLAWELRAGVWRGV